MKRTLLTVIGICLTIAVTASAAEPTPAEMEAFKLYKEAQAQMELSQYDQAIESLNRAWIAFRMPQIAILKAKALRARGDLGTALMVLKGVASDEPKIRAKVDAAIAEIEAEMSKPIEIDVSSTVDQVRMVIDKTAVFFIPGKITVTPGLHRIEYTAPGYKARSEERSFGPADTAMMVSMDQVGGKVVLKTNLDSFFGVVVKIDDRELMPSGSSLTPNKTSPIEIPAGTHTYTCMKNGLPDYSGSFELVSTQILEVECLLAPVNATARRPGAAGPWKWVFLGVGSSMAVAGSGLMGWYFYNREKYGPPSSGDHYEGWIGLGLAGVGVAVAVMGFFIFPDKKTDRATADDDTAVKPTYGFAVAPIRDGAAASLAITF